jgi:hypothetical protein
VTAESNDLLNELSGPVVVLEGAWGIRLECRQFHRPFLALINLVIFASHMVPNFMEPEVSLNKETHYQPPYLA